MEVAFSVANGYKGLPWLIPSLSKPGKLGRSFRRKGVCGYCIVYKLKATNYFLFRQTKALLLVARARARPRTILYSIPRLYLSSAAAPSLPRIASVFLHYVLAPLVNLAFRTEQL